MHCVGGGYNRRRSCDERSVNVSASTMGGEPPEETVRVAHAAFPKGNVYLTIRDQLGIVYDDSTFARLFSHTGQPAIAAWRLAWVTILQFAEGLTDRQAAEAVRGRIDWKYLLGLPLEDAGFDYSVLSEFRGRLVKGGVEHQLLDKLLMVCKAQGWLKAGDGSEPTRPMCWQPLNAYTATNWSRRCWKQRSTHAPSWHRHG